MTSEQIVSIVMGAMAVIIVVGYLICNQRNKIMEWLKYAVVEAEKYLGGGTGQLKLRQVYDWFIEQFPIVAAFVPFGVFSAWVDEALKTMDEWLSSNKNIKKIVEDCENG